MVNKINPIGFIQGRLSPMVDRKIQAFPWEHWQEEFKVAHDNSFNLMEWTLDQYRLYENPFMTSAGQQEIKELSKKFEISIPSLTGDCFMQAPFYKQSGSERDALLRDIESVVNACHMLGVEFIVIPLVDNGRLENMEQEDALLKGLSATEANLKKYGLKIVFESDFPPDRLKAFIAQFSPDHYGINYDIGNSAALGFDLNDEIIAYGHRILNVHIKDRVYNGTTVPLGQGDADIPKVLQRLKSIGYSGNYILQTVRAVDDDHVGVLCKYRDQVVEWLKQ